MQTPLTEHSPAKLVSMYMECNAVRGTPVVPEYCAHMKDYLEPSTGRQWRDFVKASIDDVEPGALPLATLAAAAAQVFDFVRKIGQ